MSIASDLRLLAGTADKKAEAFERLHFCAVAHVTAMGGDDPKESQRTLEQLATALRATAPALYL